MRPLALTVLAVLALTAVACGGDDLIRQSQSAIAGDSSRDQRTDGGRPCSNRGWRRYLIGILVCPLSEHCEQAASAIAQFAEKPLKLQCVRRILRKRFFRQQCWSEARSVYFPGHMNRSHINPPEVFHAQ